MTNSANNEKCPLGIQLQTEVKAHGRDLARLADTDREQWAKLETVDNKLDEFKGWISEQLRKFVPAWVTVVLMASSFITGSSLTFAGMIMRMDGRQQAAATTQADTERVRATTAEETVWRPTETETAGG